MVDDNRIPLNAVGIQKIKGDNPVCTAAIASPAVTVARTTFLLPSFCMPLPPDCRPASMTDLPRASSPAAPCPPRRDRDRVIPAIRVANWIARCPSPPIPRIATRSPVGARRPPIASDVAIPCAHQRRASTGFEPSATAADAETWRDHVRASPRRTSARSPGAPACAPL